MALPTLLFLVLTGAVTATLAFSLWRIVTKDVGAFPEAGGDAPRDIEPPSEYRYYTLDQEFFRARVGGTGVAEIFRMGRWVPYKGDALEPIALGKLIRTDRLPEGATELANLREARIKVARQIEILLIGRHPANSELMIRRLKQILTGINQRISEIESGSPAGREREH